MNWLIGALMFIGEKALHLVFDYIDKNDDGKISEDEIKQFLEVIGGLYDRILSKFDEE